MNRSEFFELVHDIVDTYGVYSCLDNEDDIEENNLWFNCPNCGDQILYDDFKNDKDLHAGFCPICQFQLFD